MPGRALSRRGDHCCRGQQERRQFIVADEAEIRRRGEAGELAKKDAALGLGYRVRSGAPAAPAPAPRAARIPEPRAAPARRPWTAEQEKIVRLYHGMGLNPRQIADRARENTPQVRVPSD
ncbi:MAG: hypothetical protein H0V41_09500 [Pseudonocardiales bacterium]|nr:hypothetical protein [Pseudonocardiales bacterium]